MRRAILGSSAAITALIAGIAAFSYSPAGCSCTEIWTDYVVLAGLHGGNGLEDITADRLQSGLQANLGGKTLTIGEFALGGKYGCARRPPDLVVCHSVFESSPLLDKGFDVSYALDADGVVRTVRVARFVEIRQRRS